jgi:hypothetical protein
LVSTGYFFPPYLAFSPLALMHWIKWKKSFEWN